MQSMSRPAGPASKDRVTEGATRSTVHGETSTTSSSSLARPEPATTTQTSSFFAQPAIR